MTKQKQQISDDGVIEYFGLIPVYLVISNILSRLPVKSIAQCRCVSKLWSSIIRLPNYEQLFPTKSPRFLFSTVCRGNFFFYTSPQPQNPDENSSLVATPHHTISGFSRISSPVHGLICHQRRTGDNWIEVVIYNPITGQPVTLPKVKADMVHSISYLGYDPIDKLFKVLFIYKVFCGAEKKQSYLEHQVLTLEMGRRNLLWRKIKRCNCIPLSSLGTDDGICINGVLYYSIIGNKRMIGCFDVRSERFYYIIRKPSTLINYKGRLGAADNRDHKDFVLWVLEDAEEHKWSKHIYKKPLQWQRKLYSMHIAGVTDTGEIVLCSRYATEFLFYIYYYNLEKNMVVSVRVETPAFEDSKWSSLHTFPNYVDDVKLM